jgi:hypothetical protein
MVEERDAGGILVVVQGVGVVAHARLPSSPRVTAHSEVIVPTPTNWTRHLALHRSTRREGTRDFPEARFVDANPVSGRPAVHQWSMGIGTHWGTLGY